MSRENGIWWTLKLETKDDDGNDEEITLNDLEDSEIYVICQGINERYFRGGIVIDE